MLQELVHIITGIRDEKEMMKFFGEIFTEKELKDLALRWQLMQEIQEGRTQRAIAATHHISLCKITRGAKILKNKKSLSYKFLTSNT